MAKISEAKVPGVGSVNILSPTAWLQMILGVVMLLIAIAIGQGVKNKVGSKLPIDTTIEPFTAAPQAPAGPGKKVY
jgi:hypothetical protein